MNIELKNIRHLESMSEETNCFTAKLYIDGVYVADVQNDGHGGEHMVYANTGHRDTLEKANRYFEGLPKEKRFFGDGEFEFQPSLESKIDDLLESWFNAKHLKRFEAKKQKDMQKGILIAENPEDPYSYSLRYWKGHTLAQMLASAQGRNAIKQAVRQETSRGFKILNTNIPAELL